MGEVESQFGWGHERSLLINMVAEYFPQAEIENVRRGVIVS